MGVFWVGSLPLWGTKRIKGMSDTNCPVCQSGYVYAMDLLMVCPECGWEGQIGEPGLATEAAPESAVKDANGNPLQDGDSVILIKDLPVKGAPKPLKKGTKVTNIRLVDGDHNIDCKIPGYGAMALKSEFVKKA
jgi:protein PhnA